MREFDFIVMSDLINELEDVQDAFERLRRFSSRNTRLCLNYHNTLWRPVLQWAERWGLKRRFSKPPSWLSGRDVANLLNLAGWEVVKTESRILLPIYVPVLSALLNRWLAPLLRHLCLTLFTVARPKPTEEANLSCTVVIPARNEAGNIAEAIRRLPDLGPNMEILFVEGGSQDQTWEEIVRAKNAFPQKRIVAVKQTGQGKGAAVRDAFDAATGDVLMILDGDLSVAPEDMTKFYQAIRSGVGDFVNGVRLVYPMEDQSMRFLNLAANKLFSLCFSWLLGQSVKDTLCGTKVLRRADYARIAEGRAYFGDFDPFGDFDLLFGAARLNLKIIDLPVRYHARTYGATNIHRWSAGWQLMKMTIVAAKKLKFIG